MNLLHWSDSEEQGRDDPRDGGLEGSRRGESWEERSEGEEEGDEGRKGEVKSWEEVGSVQVEGETSEVKGRRKRSREDGKEGRRSALSRRRERGQPSSDQKPTQA